MVDFFLKPQRFRRSGAKIPRGILLCGPPGAAACFGILCCCRAISSLSHALCPARQPERACGALPCLGSCSPADVDVT